LSLVLFRYIKTITGSPSAHISSQIFPSRFNLWHARKSVDEAHNENAMKDAHIYYATDILVDANINRSPSSYLNNPAWERAKWD
jgi:hypothetical protein